MRRLLPLLLSSMFLLNACGNSRIERAGSGAVIGGTSGVVVGGLCCQDPGSGITAGFFIGAAVGAIAGYLLDRPLFFDTTPRPRQ